MQLIIRNKDNYSKTFIYNYLPRFIYELAKVSCDNKKLQLIDREFNINSKDIILMALKNLDISENSTEYTIKINKNKRYKGANISGLINVITFGNRDVQGCPVVYNIFDIIAKNIDILYDDWVKEN